MTYRKFFGGCSYPQGVYHGSDYLQFLAFLQSCPKLLRQFGMELAIVALIGFGSSLALASQSGDLKNTRYHFLESGRDWSIVLITGWVVYRAANGLRRKE